MWKPAHDIKVGSSSIIELKAALLKKKEEFDLEKTTKGTAVKRALSNKKPIVQNKGVEERSKKDSETAQFGEPSAQLSYEALKRKEKQYERLTKGIDLVDDLSEKQQEDLLVDFKRKRYEDESDQESASNSDANESDQGSDPYVEFVDEYGRNRVVRRSEIEEMESEREKQSKSEEYMEMKRAQWDEEYEKKISAPAGPQFYDYNKEIRTKGTGYYQFSLDESQRLKQKEELDALRKETIQKRRQIDELKEKRKKMLETRLIKLAERKKKQKTLMEELPTDADEQID